MVANEPMPSSVTRLTCLPLFVPSLALVFPSLPFAPLASPSDLPRGPGVLAQRLSARSANAADRYLGLTGPYPSQDVRINLNQPRPYFSKTDAHLKVVLTEVRPYSDLKVTALL
jgi:hypothetical protein